MVPGVPLCVGSKLIHNWHCRLLRLSLLQGSGLEAADPVIGFVPPFLLGELVTLGIPLGLCHHFVLNIFGLLVQLIDGPLKHVPFLDKYGLTFFQPALEIS